MMANTGVYFTVVLLLTVSTAFSAPYYGKLIGSFSTIQHGVSGNVYAAGPTELIIRDFTFSGTVDDTFFWIGTSTQPNANGIIVPVDPRKPNEELKAYNNAELVLGLPAGRTINEFRSLAVWRRSSQVSFGAVQIASDFVAPAVHDLGVLPNYAHQVRADSVKVLDAKTLRFENLDYDGSAPDAFFWAGTTADPTSAGFRLIWKPELPATGNNQKLDRAFNGETILVTMPEGVTVFDITYVGLWCVTFTQDFGHVDFPNQLNIPPVVPARSWRYFGVPIGSFSRLAHGVEGMVYAASPTRLIIRGFSYDGTAPDAFLWIGSSSRPSSSGTIVPVDPTNPSVKLGAFSNAQLQVDLPSGTVVTDYKSLSVWCRTFQANFGDVKIASNFVAPASHDLGVLPTYAHRVRADSVRVLDAKTLRFENLEYDGSAPDAYFWAGRTSNSDPTSTGIRLIWKPDLPATGSNQRLDRAFRGETILVTMPEGMTVLDINHVGLWCVIFTQDFGHVDIDPNELKVPIELEERPFDHCEQLADNDLQVSWKIAGDTITVELAGRVTPGNYMAFGPSGSDTRTQMGGSDVVVAWMDPQTMSAMAVDYNLQSYAQCSINNGNGACPDETTAVGGANNVVLEGLSSDNGITRISFSRPLTSSESIDRPIPTDSGIYVSWAIGPINNDGRVAKHTKIPTGNVVISFGRQGTTTCRPFTAGSGDGDGGTQLPPWAPSSIENETNFTVEIGQSGGERGYTGITGKVGWGIAWYVNDLLIPEITVQRGTTYTFRIFGGDDPALSAQYHPFYITDDDKGGYAQKTQAEKMGVTIYAGPTEGPYCEWEVSSLDISPDNYDSFLAYRANLMRVCKQPNPTPGLLTWTPDDSTPDLVYYQCYTHRFLGWKIRVVGGDSGGDAGTMPVPTGAGDSTTEPSTGGAVTTVTASSLLVLTSFLALLLVWA